MNMDARIQQSVVDNLAGRPLPVEAGPFLIGLDPATTNPGINYATPRPGHPITATDVDTLVRVFTENNRKPRLEYVLNAAPALEGLLLAAGFTVEERHDYLVCSPSTFASAPVPAGFTVREPASDADRVALARAQAEAFMGAAAAAGLDVTADAARMARMRARGGEVIMAVTDSGECAGGGLAVAPNSGVCEVAGIAVREQFRRQGLAAAVTSVITERLFAGGVEVAWLEASGADSARIYGRAGYLPTGKRLYIAR